MRAASSTTIMRYEAQHVEGLHSFLKSYQFVIKLTFPDS